MSELRALRGSKSRPGLPASIISAPPRLCLPAALQPSCLITHILFLRVVFLPWVFRIALAQNEMLAPRLGSVRSSAPKFARGLRARATFSAPPRLRLPAALQPSLLLMHTNIFIFGSCSRKSFFSSTSTKRYVRSSPRLCTLRY